jgi:hypothetical protein
LSPDRDTGRDGAVTDFSALVFASIALRVLNRDDIGSETAVRHIPHDTDRGDDLADRGDTDTESACVWIAEVTVEGRTYTARSRHGAANELARQLVAAGLADRPMVIRHHE